MSKQPRERSLDETEAQAVLRNLRISPQKLNLVAALIRGKDCGLALNVLAFSKRRIARDVKKVLESAIANAENNHQLDVDRLFVKEASVGRGLVMKRFHARARGRGARIVKPFSHLTVIVRERQDAAAKETD
ncbi:MAG: 50S ribosomal protein L22 [Thalassobaculales bacterium]